MPKQTLVLLAQHLGVTLLMEGSPVKLVSERGTSRSRGLIENDSHYIVL